MFAGLKLLYCRFGFFLMRKQYRMITDDSEEYHYAMGRLQDWLIEHELGTASAYDTVHLCDAAGTYLFSSEFSIRRSVKDIILHLEVFTDDEV